MIIEDRGAKLPHYTIDLGERYRTVSDMRTAGAELISAGKSEAILGLSSIAIGAAVYARGRLKDDETLNKVGLTISLQGVGGVVDSLVSMNRGSTLKLASVQIRTGLERGTVVVKPSDPKTPRLRRALWGLVKR